ncbi:MAG: hypothetical protein QOI66_4720 [Myxococcales bacterium]|jgi:hypothetical protein|nr:hypothetical protein [Myxococcales bacterium]
MTTTTSDHAAPSPRSDDGWSLGTFVGAAAGVLAARALYLLRFGWDIGWMNLGYLENSRLIALGRHQSVEEQPLTYFALLAGRRLGFDARAANEAVYLVAHLLLALGVLGLARFVWPAARARRRGALGVALAVTPLLAYESGRNNLGAALAAGLAASALAMAATAATATRLRAGVAVQLLIAALLAALASTGRYEALATCAGGALVLALLGGRMPAVRQHRAAAVALGAGVVVGVLAVITIRRALAGGVVAASSTYGLYTFYDGLPLLMFPHLPSTEYARYRASVQFFGGFDANHGSVLHALVHHPGWALLRFLTKPVDHLAVLLWFYGLTPIGVALAAVGVRGIARRPASEWQRGWLLAAFLLPLGMLFVPQQNPAYYLSVAAPLLLAMARGADRVATRLEPRTVRIVAGATVLIGVALIAVAGKRTISNSHALNQAAAYLETRCQAGCLTNALPQAIGSQVWAVTDAGAPFPPRLHRNEQIVMQGFRPRDADAYNYCTRVARSRTGGFVGPVLYVDARIKTFTAFDPDFDPTVRYQGTLDRTNLVEERRFSTGSDEVTIYNLPDNIPCRHVAGSTE